MLFDKAAAIAERQLPELVPFFKRSRVFQFPGRAHEVRPMLQLDQPWLTQDTFRLPFPYIAIEDSASCILLWASDEGQLGLNQHWHSIECLPMNAAVEEFDKQDYIPSTASSDRSMIFLKGECGSLVMLEGLPMRPFSYDQEFGLIGGVVADKDKIVMSPQHFNKYYKHDNEQIRACARNMRVAMEEVMFFMSPNNLILEELPTRTSKQGKGPAITRAGYRKSYTVIRPQEVRAKFGLPKSDGTGREFLGRRAHYRLYGRTPAGQARYTKMRGKQVMMPPVIPEGWDGEFRKKDKRYKIRFDL